ncbi:D-alanyl-D-alanine carboxypeptidase family protein [Paenibacillus montanisoli]|uniref:D-alanyl-D-alanine carboxypeptidase family protein n=2 Tax=Paenibacillus montanisoli TaxID=2081970 RepID=A0A328TYV3_9BACL|nr:D-alanyl-D-alanine carboxypeptidase family protein [Paenibacillus montanisoli]
MTQTSCTNDWFGRGSSDSSSKNAATAENAAAGKVKTSTGKSDDDNSGSAANAGSASTDSDKESVSASATSQSSALLAFLRENSPSKTIKKKNGVDYVTNTDSPLILVNKKRELASTYVPHDLVKAKVAFSFSGDSPKQQMRKVAAEALEKLFAGAEKDGIELKAVSGYRSYVSQHAVFNNYVKKNGEQEANTFSAHPGQSEHQTGLAMDVSSASAGYDLTTDFGDTKEGKWLKEHAADYGFIIRYELGKEEETGYMYEPWHIRYVGVFIAQDIKKRGDTLEAYLAQF